MEKKPAPPWFLLLLILCWCCTPLGFDGMENRYAAQCLSLVERGSFNIDPYARLSIDIAQVEGHYYPACPPGLPLLATPLAWVASKSYDALPLTLRSRMAEKIERSSHFYRPEAEDEGDIGRFLFTLICLRFFLMAPIALLLYFGLYSLLERRSPILPLLALLGTNLFFYLPRFYTHSLTACLLTWGLVWVREPSPLRPKKAFLGGLTAASLPFLDYPWILGALFLGALFLYRRPSRKELGFALFGAAPPIVLFMAYHQMIFGGPITLAHRYIVGFENHHQGLYGLVPPSWEALLEVLLSPSHGFFLYAFLLLPFLLRERGLILILFAAMSLVEAAFLTSGGNAGPIWGQRHLTPLIPLLAPALLGWGKALPWLALPNVTLHLLAGAAPFDGLFRGPSEVPLFNLLTLIATGETSLPLLDLLQRFHLMPLPHWLPSLVITAGAILFASRLSLRVAHE